METTRGGRHVLPILGQLKLSGNLVFKKVHSSARKLALLPCSPERCPVQEVGRARTYRGLSFLSVYSFLSVAMTTNSPYSVSRTHPPHE